MQLKGKYRINSKSSKDQIQIVEKDLKKCSTSSAISQMEIKATLKFQLTLGRMAKIIKQMPAHASEKAGKGGNLFTGGGRAN